jgi:hypothetical protein
MAEQENPWLRLSEQLVIASSRIGNAADRCREAANNFKYMYARVGLLTDPMRSYRRMQRKGQEWTHTDPDQAGQAPVVALSPCPPGDWGLVACTVTEEAVRCPLGCCRLWVAVPQEPVDIVIAAAPGDDRNAVVTGLGAGDSVVLRLHAMAPRAGQ